MRSRTDILKDLIYLKGNLTELQSELSQYSWDTEDSFLTIDKNVFIDILQRCISGKLSFKGLEDWANAIECRDDLDFENDRLQEIIFELANPDLNGEITKDRILQIINQL